MFFSTVWIFSSADLKYYFHVHLIKTEIYQYGKKEWYKSLPPTTLKGNQLLCCMFRNAAWGYISQNDNWRHIVAIFQSSLVAKNASLLNMKQHSKPILLSLCDAFLSETGYTVKEEKGKWFEGVKNQRMRILSAKKNHCRGGTSYYILFQHAWMDAACTITPEMCIKKVNGVSFDFRLNSMFKEDSQAVRVSNSCSRV